MDNLEEYETVEIKGTIHQTTHNYQRRLDSSKKAAKLMSTRIVSTKRGTSMTTDINNKVYTDNKSSNVNNEFPGKKLSMYSGHKSSSSPKYVDFDEDDLADERDKYIVANPTKFKPK